MILLIYGNDFSNIRKRYQLSWGSAYGDATLFLNFLDG